MTRFRGSIALLGLLSLGPTLPAAAQAGDGSALVDEVAGLNRSLARLVGLLESSLHHQRVDLVLKRIALRERRIAPAGSALRSQRNALVDAESELTQLREMLEREREGLQRQIREGADQPDSPTRDLIVELESVIRTQEERRDNVIRLIRDLEDEVAEGQERIEALEELLDELLE